MQRGGRLRVFAYVDAENAHLYRAIMGRFMEAKERFRIHLRPPEVLESLDPTALAWTPADPLAAIRDLLRALRDWGNLDEHPDTADVATVEEFYQPRFLYQLTPDGEAAERAISYFEQNIRAPGELQAAALDDIRHLLRELEQLVDELVVDAAKVTLTVRTLRERFDELTIKAQVFVGSLQRTIDLRGASVVDFVAYKDLLIDYLERFIGELVIATAEIAAQLERLDGPRLETVLELVATRELADAVEVAADARNQAIARWRGRWLGLRSWFIGTAATPSQAEVLRARARSAIPALLSAAAAIHERRNARSDRATDLRTLARWFAELQTDEQCHRLFRAAFGLSPCRHLSIDQASLVDREAEPVSAHVSWLDAPSLRISPRLRASGRYTRRGRPNNVIDRSADKARLAALAQAEAEQIAEAQKRLAGGKRIRLAEIGELDEVAFGLLLDLLGEALSRKTCDDEEVVATSADGTLQIVLGPTGDRRVATIKTTNGELVGPDHFVTISETASADWRAEVEAAS
jgi:uncharacterized protein (TIGR02677 family)